MERRSATVKFYVSVCVKLILLLRQGNGQGKTPGDVSLVWERNEMVGRFSWLACKMIQVKVFFDI